MCSVSSHITVGFVFSILCENSSSRGKDAGKLFARLLEEGKCEKDLEEWEWEMFWAKKNEMSVGWRFIDQGLIEDG